MINRNQPIEIIVCNECSKSPKRYNKRDKDGFSIYSLEEVWNAIIQDDHLCGGCRWNKKMAQLLDIPFVVIPSEAGY
jgi:protein-arginine kinase activator protein McsA